MKIQELGEQLANQIAAGEVVERPASVVKELLENSMDAGSTKIEINLEGAGLAKIQVIDDGEGISKDDVLMAFKQHATSKIQNIDDLFRVRTLGFRGEALPSIASVSDVFLETAVVGEDVGSFVHLKGGKIERQSPAPLRKGTKITVENLFYNTPARLKYMRSLQTEFSVISEMVHRLSLSHPEISFRLIHDGKKVFETVGNGDLKAALAGIYGIASAKKMISLKASDLDVELAGYISKPELSRKNKKYISILINGRYIRNFLLNRALLEGYGSKLMVGRFPIATLFIQTDPLLVDVNVHPAKLEVRLSKEKELMALITCAVSEALSKEQLIPDGAENLSFKRNKISAQEHHQMNLSLSSREKSTEISQSFVKKSSSLNAKPYVRMQNLSPKLDEIEKEERETKLVYDEDSGQFFAIDKSMAFVKEEISEIEETDSLVDIKKDMEFVKLEERDFEKKENAGLEKSKKAIDKIEGNKFPDIEYFGQMHGTYLFAQGQDGFYIIDQHAAQERVKYEYYREEMGKASNDFQELLLPIILDYPFNDMLIIQESKELLQQVGIFLERYGENSFVLRRHPMWYPKGQEEFVVREMLDLFLATGKVSVKEFREDVAILMSCKRSIKANHALSPEEARALLSDLANCQNPFNCPHGRPTLISFSNKDIEKMFKRIQDVHVAFGDVED
ncbi:MAG: DNA mismatch repair endonuclease MutL [Lactobacillales bacterium]|jgi:DNA mismatch repair protein MutL|nr:DNA mismatch repair endonuclease MutL [Lactobacillales bacterium]